jgi:hypothetical protein
VCFSYIPWICWDYNFFKYVSLIELNAWEDEWFIIIEALQEGKRKRGDIICGPYTNACKMSAKWDEQDFKNHKNWSQQI